MPVFFRACRHHSTKSAKWGGGHLIPFAPCLQVGSKCPLCPPPAGSAANPAFMYVICLLSLIRTVTKRCVVVSLIYVMLCYINTAGICRKIWGLGSFRSSHQTVSGISKNLFFHFCRKSFILDAVKLAELSSNSFE